MKHINFKVLSAEFRAKSFIFVVASLFLLLTACGGANYPVTQNPQSSQNTVASSSSIPVAVSSARSSVVSSAVSSRASSSRAAVNFPPVQGGSTGWSTRYWDCCKPHCGWRGNTQHFGDPLPSCDANNNIVADENATSGCTGGGAYTCYNLAPWVEPSNPNISYGYAATHANSDICGRCYQLEFTGPSSNSPNDPGSEALRGKTMIVQATNIGGDVGSGQFDLLIPGGGVGLFNGCSTQWGIPSNQLGAQYGGLLTACKQELGGNRSRQEYKSCLANKCRNVFGSRGLNQLEQGCLWHAEWFEAADNPGFRYKEIACPSELSDKTGMSRL